MIWYMSQGKYLMKRIISTLSLLLNFSRLNRRSLDMYVTMKQELAPRERCQASNTPDHIIQHVKRIIKVIIYLITSSPSLKDAAFLSTGYSAI
jgi:hypothetical protein